MHTSLYPRFSLLLLIAAAGAPQPSLADSVDDALVDEIVVTSQRREQPRLEHVGNVERLRGGDIDGVRHQHLHELFTRVPGVWLSRGSGQESLAAIRSPVLTGAGSCGAFLTLEDGIPTRPAGFCNVNQLFELNTEQASAIEIVRGPGSALYGSNALHGIVNVLTPTIDSGAEFGVEAGANDFRRVRARWSGDSRLLAALVFADDGGFRSDSGYQQTKLHLKTSSELHDGELTVSFSASDLAQETAGFIFGPDAYADPALNRGNVNPEAFRDASSQRLSTQWRRTSEGRSLALSPYVRHSEMDFLQHFLPGQPLEQNGHTSAGLLASATFESDDRTVIVGIDLEWADVFLRETQDGPTLGSPFLVETRPEGKHYDYDVSSSGIAPYVQLELRPNDRLSISAGLRAEYLRYRYDNRMLDGNTRDDGSACGFGGCLYTRPADRSDEFHNVAPSLGIVWILGDDRSLFANLSRGFRAPQMTELYRLQSGQQVADLDSERVDSLEVGVRVLKSRVAFDAALYAMRKEDSVFRDADGFNVSGAGSSHSGLEFGFDLAFGAGWRLSLDASYGRHQYTFDRVAARGETFVSGRDVDTAPRWLGSAELARNGAIDLSLQWTMIGEYYLDAENRFSYPGHDILNLRGGTDLTRNLRLGVRINNLLDEDYADRADFAFGQYRYFPGRGRELFVDLTYTPAESPWPASGLRKSL